MNTPLTTFYVLGSGLAGRAIRQAVLTLKAAHPEFPFSDVTFIPRGSALSEVVTDPSHSVIAIANPTGLHTEYAVQAEALRVPLIILEKPTCTSLPELELLSRITTPTAVLHGYRVQWGIEKIKHLITQGELGTIFGIEIRYWQSSAAKASRTTPSKKSGWKSDVALNGPHDVVLDLGTHAMDLALHLSGSAPTHLRYALNFTNAEAPHRDTHATITIRTSNGVLANLSVSKNVHGAGNELEVCVLGSNGSASWQFAIPDRVVVGSGSNHTTIARQDPQPGSLLPPFHGMGWVEGYIEIIRRSVSNTVHGTNEMVPTLSDSVDAMRAFLHGERDDWA